ncbi:MAG: Nif3-like dinuclear metal center hexameric protein [Candidatus Hodarchaeales archaeon]|jgi:putative NIF3 family GTP cyclohydrolase 1 type 2/rhodanese-related sulfurtransferase
MLEKISLSKLRQSLSQDSESILLDVRTFQEYQKAHISGAISVPLHEIRRNASKFPRDQKFVVYCQNAPCSMSTQAAFELKSLGFQNICKLEGGFDEWNILGYPIESQFHVLPISPSLSSREINSPILAKMKRIHEISQKEFIPSDDVVEFLEKSSPIYDFEYSHINHGDKNISLGYEIKTVDKINTIYLMINPDPRNMFLVPSHSLVISHHKISCYNNWIYKEMLDQAQTTQFNIYNFHLAWDSMRDGIGDSFLFHLGIPREQIQKVDLTYKNVNIPRLGSIINSSVSLEEIITRLNALNVNPSVIINPKCQNSKVGYIPGGGFVDDLIIQMAEYGTDVLVSSDPNWVVEIIARELGMTLIAIDHYTSERYGLQAMQQLLISSFHEIPTIILENVDSIQCPPDDCPCCVEGHLHNVPVK